MCLHTKIGDQEYLAFYMPVPGSTERIGRIELRDESFQAVPLESIATDANVMVRDSDETEWHKLSLQDTKDLVRVSMFEALVGLRRLSQQPT